MPEPTVTLRNRTKRLLVLNLPHAVSPEAATMAVVGAVDHDGTAVRGPKDASAPTAGLRTLVGGRRPISGSVTLTARGCPEKGDVAEGLPRSVLTAPDVLRAKQAGDVSVEEVAARPDPAPAPPGEKSPEGDAPGKAVTKKAAGKTGGKDTE